MYEWETKCVDSAHFGRTFVSFVVANVELTAARLTDDFSLFARNCFRWTLERSKQIDVRPRRMLDILDLGSICCRTTFINKRLSASQCVRRLVWYVAASARRAGSPKIDPKLSQTNFEFMRCFDVLRLARERTGLGSIGHSSNNNKCIPRAFERNV